MTETNFFVIITNRQAITFAFSCEKAETGKNCLLVVLIPMKLQAIYPVRKLFLEFFLSSALLATTQKLQLFDGHFFWILNCFTLQVNVLNIAQCTQLLVYTQRLMASFSCCSISPFHPLGSVGELKKVSRCASPQEITAHVAQGKRQTGLLGLLSCCPLKV